jgi:hypothetical protein
MVLKMDTLTEQDLSNWLTANDVDPLNLVRAKMDVKSLHHPKGVNLLVTSYDLKDGNRIPIECSKNKVVAKKKSRRVFIKTLPGGKVATKTNVLEWLSSMGLDYNEVSEVSFPFASMPSFPVWLRVKRYVRGPSGNRFFLRSEGRIASESLLVRMLPT